MIISRLNNPDARIPEELREIYAHFVGILIETLGALDELTILFSTSKEAVELMNKTAPTFFARHEQLLIQHIILSVARLTDPRQSGSRKNAQDNLTLRWKTISTAAQPFRQYRHKLLAHASLAEYLSPATKVGDKITLASMNVLLTQIGDYLGAFDCFFTSVDTGFYYPRSYGEAGDLLAYLKLAVEAEKKENDERLQAATALRRR
jgi:hypothetical protein